MSSIQNRIINNIPQKTFDGLFLDNIKLPEEFKVMKIESEMLPEVSPKIKDLPNKVGSLYSGTSLGSRLITITLRGLGQSLYNHVQLQNKLNNWIKPSLFTPTSLIIGFNRFQSIDVILNSTPDIEVDNFDIVVTLEFLAPDPLWKGENEIEVLSPNNGFYKFHNPSNFYCKPSIEFTLNKDLTNLAVVSGDEAIILGSDIGIDTNKTPVDNFIINNVCNSLNGFTDTSSLYNAQVLQQESRENLTIDGGNWKIIPANTEKPFGDTGSGWVALTRTLQGKKTTTKDFYANMVFSIDDTSKDKKVNGRMQFEILSTTGTRMIVLQMYDNSDKVNELKIDIFMCDHLGNVADKPVKNFKIPVKYNNFYGNFEVWRKGKNYTFKCTYHRGSRPQILYRKFYDGSNKYSATPQSISFAFISWIGRPFPKFSCNHLTLRSDDKINNDTEVEIIAKTGDKILIDNESGKIYKNEVLWLQHLAINSEFLSFENPECIFAISPSDATSSVEVSYTPCWL